LHPTSNSLSIYVLYQKRDMTDDPPQARGTKK
jgi:hypothetical protein